MRIQPQGTLSPALSEKLELFVAKSGTLSARINRNGSMLHLHSSVKPEDEAKYFDRIDFWGDLIVFLGTGLGYHVRPYLNAIPPNARILLVDYYPRCVEHCRGELFNGLPNDITAISSATDDRDRLVARLSLDAQKIQIIKHPAAYAANRRFYDGIADTLRFKHIRKKENGPALLFFGDFFLEEELRRALARCDSGMATFKYNDTRDCAAFESALAKAVQEKRPRFILSVNMKGFDSNGMVSDVAWRLGVPLVVWFVDDPHPIMLHQKSFIKNNMIALTWERAYLPWLKQQGFGACAYLPLAGDPELFTPGSAEKPIAEIGFVGSSMGRRFLDNITSRFLWNATLEPLVHAAAQSLLIDRSRPVGALVRDLCRELGVSLPFSDDKNITWLCSYIIHTASMVRRKELVEACIPLGMQTFGDPEGWKEFVGAALPAHPDIDYRTGLSQVYRAIDISINMTSCQMPTAVNQRVFDAPLSGGFIVNDFQSDLESLFAPDEIAVYRSKEELIEKLAYFRSRKAERDRIVHKARSHILAQHTYDHRIAAIRALIP
jgi:spore maturation protein CgeB